MHVRILVTLLSAGFLMGCAAPESESNRQNLNVAECRALAEETRRSGRPNYNLCPGYMPDGYTVESELN